MESGEKNDGAPKFVPDFVSELVHHSKLVDVTTTFLDFDSGLKTPPPLITVELFEISNLLIIEKIDVLLLISESLNRFNQQRYGKDTQRTFCKTESNGPSKK